MPAKAGTHARVFKPNGSEETQSFQLGDRASPHDARPRAEANMDPGLRRDDGYGYRDRRHSSRGEPASTASDTSKLRETFCTSSSSSSAAMSFMIDGGVVLVDRGRQRRLPHRLDASGSPSLASSAAATVPRLSNGAGHDMAGGVGRRVVRAGLDRRFEHGIGAAGRGLIHDLAHVREHVRDRARGAEVAAVLREHGPHGAARAVAVVGQRLGDDGDAARRIALVADRLVGFACRRPAPS